MQRIFDVVFSGLALLVLAPLMLPLICLLRLTGEGEVFFLQPRVGRNGELFKLFKFATMLKDSPNIGTGTVTLHQDNRVLPLGGFLRSAKINELPQLINIFIGEMSIIGPRPQTQRCFDAFPKSAQHSIAKVPPGLSGIGSIIFRREEEMMHFNMEPDKFYDEVIMPFKGSLEQWYVENRSMRNYFVLIALTVWVVVFKKSDMIWKSFDGLPKPPEELGEWM